MYNKNKMLTTLWDLWAGLTNSMAEQKISMDEFNKLVDIIKKALNELMELE